LGNGAKEVKLKNNEDSELYGSKKSEGVEFNDYQQIEGTMGFKDMKLFKIIVWTKEHSDLKRKFISGIETIYTLGNEIVSPGSHLGTIISENKDFESKSEFTLGPHDEITSIAINYGNYIDGIRITCNKGNPYEAGSEKGDNKILLELDKDSTLLAISGRTSEFLDRIKFHFKK
jgi:hypothetical protein